MRPQTGGCWRSFPCQYLFSGVCAVCACTTSDVSCWRFWRRLSHWNLPSHNYAQFLMCWGFELRFSSLTAPWFLKVPDSCIECTRLIIQVHFNIGELFSPCHVKLWNNMQQLLLDWLNHNSAEVSHTVRAAEWTPVVVSALGSEHYRLPEH